jgi:hypothetical protein
MEHLEHPSLSLWESRREWFENMINSSEGNGSYFVSDHATALLAELQCCYCAGAWLAVIVISISVIDAQIRETEAGGDSKINTAKLLNTYYKNDYVDELRMTRNKIVHINCDNPFLSLDKQYGERKSFEREAQVAASLAIQAFFNSPGT